MRRDRERDEEGDTNRLDEQRRTGKRLEPSMLGSGSGWEGTEGVVRVALPFSRCFLRFFFLWPCLVVPEKNFMKFFCHFDYELEVLNEG